ncbi:FBP domain-containing protein [Dactylosporangium fulvum]|uniref:FBP domain-containing protein n=1 Tax=Dactylosporangium fulvum TaxID=53359 RepID=A0ABY5VNX5_9ACTN|nr:FBP domain-containing protein [Dactylosporangium fulvum]UWP78804.1 FBP domain-containing protein [Dactylosporangium fulvum]
MKALTEHDIRTSFVNCSKGEAQRAALPRDLADRPWADLDFLGWRDPGALDRAYLVAEHGDRIVGVALRIAVQRRGFLHRNMCSLCLTTHPGAGVSMMTARKAGRAGRDGNSAGLYVCTDLACSLYVRGRKRPEIGGRFDETLTVGQQIERTQAKLAAFLDQLLVGSTSQPMSMKGD